MPATSAGRGTGTPAANASQQSAPGCVTGWAAAAPSACCAAPPVTECAVRPSRRSRPPACWATRAPLADLGLPRWGWGFSQESFVSFFVSRADDSLAMCAGTQATMWAMCSNAATRTPPTARRMACRYDVRTRPGGNSGEEVMGRRMLRQRARSMTRGAGACWMGTLFKLVLSKAGTVRGTHQAPAGTAAVRQRHPLQQPVS